MTQPSTLVDDTAPAARLDQLRLGPLLRTPEPRLSISKASRGLSSSPQAAPTFRSFHLQPPGGIAWRILRTIASIMYRVRAYKQQAHRARRPSACTAAVAPVS